MQVTAEHPDPCTVVLDINVDEQQVARAFDTTYKEFGRYANVPGFRPGKAPRAIVERYVNQERVRQQALEKIIRDSYFQAIQDEGIQPYRDPQIEPTDLEDKKPYTYKATVPLEPQITLGEYTGLTIEKPIFKITDQLVDERIEALREERARLERISDRGVEAGDILIVEQQTVLEEDGETGEPAAMRRQLVQLGSNVPGYDEAVIGMAIGDERTFELTYPEDYQEEDKQGKKATFTVKLSSISAKKKPALNDDFAKTLGAGETVEELREAVRERLQAEADELSNQVAEQRLFTQILANSTIYFPMVLIREQVEDDLRRLAQELRQRNMSYGQFLAAQGITAEQHQGGLAQQAEQQIRTLLALREISIQEDLQATDEQVDAEFDRLLEGGAIDEDQFEEFKPDARRRLQIANNLIQQRLHDFLFSHNTVNEIEQDTPPDPDALAEAAENAELAAADGIEEEDAAAESDVPPIALVNGSSDASADEGTDSAGTTADTPDTLPSETAESSSPETAAAETTDHGDTKTD